MYNTVYIFPKFTGDTGVKKLKEKFSDKNKKHFFYNKYLASPADRALSLVSKNVLKLVIPDTRPWLKFSLKLYIHLLFGNALMIR